MTFLKEHVKPAVNERKQVSSLILLKSQLGIAFFAFVLIGANDGALGVLIPSMRVHYGIDTATIGRLFLVQTLGYLLAAFNNGPLLEKLGNRLLLMVGAASFLLGVVTLSLRLPFAIVLTMMLPLGFGIAVIDAGLNAYIAAIPQSAAKLNYLHAFYGGGALLGPAIASAFLALAWGWNSVYVLWTGISLVILVGLGLIFRHPHSSFQQEVTQPTSNSLRTVMRLPMVWLAALFLLFYVGTEVSLGSWSYSFLTEQRHGPPLLSGWTVSGYWAGLTLSRLTLARVVQRVGEHRLIQGCLLAVMSGILLVWLVPLEAGAILGLCLTGFGLGPIFPTAIALLSKRLPSRLLPRAIGLVMSLGAGGAAIFPWLAGNVMEHAGLWSLMPYAIILTITMVLLWQALQVHPHTSQLP